MKKLMLAAVVIAATGAGMTGAGRARAAEPVTPLTNFIQAEIIATRILGDVTIARDASTSALRNNDRIGPSSSVTTGENSSVVLLFSNGATMQLRADTELAIEHFLQDPFSAAIDVAKLAEEPSISKVRLRFVRGEITVNVKRLKHSLGSEFAVNTPAGNAEVWGTTFRMNLRPKGDGTAEFRLETGAGHVRFAPKQGAPVSVVGGNSYSTTVRLPE